MARKCGCRMMHMPGKGLVGAEEGGWWGRRRGSGSRQGGLGAVPEAVSFPVSSPTPAGGAPVCSPQQYKDCANPALGKGQNSPSSPPLLRPAHDPAPAGRAVLTQATVTPRRHAAEGRVHLPQPVRQHALRQGALHGADPQPRLRPLSGPETQPQRGLHCVSRAGRGGAGTLPRASLRAHTRVGHQSAHHHRAPGPLGKQFNLLTPSLLQKGA